MDAHELMYTGRISQGKISGEWMKKVEEFLNKIFGKPDEGGPTQAFCPCSECENKKRKSRKVMGVHLCKNGFMPNYTRWVCHGEAYHSREEVVRPRLEAFDGDGGVAEWLGDYQDGTSHLSVLMLYLF
jgi:hypothetical protein